MIRNESLSKAGYTCIHELHRHISDEGGLDSFFIGYTNGEEFQDKKLSQLIKDARKALRDLAIYIDFETDEEVCSLCEEDSY